MRRLTTRLRSALSALALAALVPGVAHAGGGGALPWDTGLNSILEGLQGGTARIILTIAVVVTGVLWAVSDHGTGIRRIMQIIFGGALALSAASWMTVFGLGGALL